MNETFAKDFINLQSSLDTLPKDKSGYGYKYTDLDTIITYIKPLCKKSNIAFMQNLKTLFIDGEKVTGIETLIIHASGETVNSFVEIPEIQVGKANNAQNIGAAISYFKRYALAAAFGISSDEDIDCSSQKLESRSRESETTAPTVKNTNSKKSSTPQEKNFNKPVEKKAETTAPKYTKEQADALTPIMKATYKDGSSIFSDEEKKAYKKMLVAGEFENAYTQARDLLNARELAAAGDMF